MSFPVDARAEAGEYNIDGFDMGLAFDWDRAGDDIEREGLEPLIIY